MDPATILFAFITTIFVFSISTLIYIYMHKRHFKHATVASLTTERAQHIRQIQELQQQLKDAVNDKVSHTIASSAIHTAGIGYIVIDRQHNLISINEYATKLLDLHTVPRLPVPYSDVLTLSSDEADTSPLINDALNGRSTQLPRWTYLVRGATKIPILGSITPQKDTNETVAILICVDASDIHTSLSESDTFVSTAAHELRGPLTSIDTTLSHIMDEHTNQTPEEKQEFLNDIHTYIKDLLTLVNNLLNVTRLNERRVHVEKKQFDIAALTQKIVKLHTQIAKDKHLYLTHDNQLGICRVYGDEEKAHVIVSNLLTNAIKYTQQGGITITHDILDGKIATKVTDTGMGIPKDYHRMLFRRFRQVGGKPQQTASKSSGLGLYIAREFARLMGGDVTLDESEPGKGSTFSFTLPVSSSA